MEMDMATRILTDRTIAALRPAAAGKRYDRLDGIVPGLAVRVTDKGSKSYVLTARYPGSLNPTRRALGDVGAVSLADVRTRARAWLALIKTGVDPKGIEEAQRKAEGDKRLAALRETQATFEAVVGIFLDEYVRPRQRQAAAVERRLKAELIPHWAGRSIHSITRDDVEDLIRGIVRRPAPRYAFNVLDDMRMLFGWCVDVVPRDKPYKLTASPCDRIKPGKLIGPKNVRTRVLSDAELKALWEACDEIGYPYGPLIRTLMLTGVRLNEAAGARWPEFNGVWVIPAARFKSGQEHRLPITQDMQAHLDGLPRFKSGEHLFSARYGVHPVASFGAPKERIDKLMPAGTEPWVFHDIRRTVRTRLSALQIADHVAEMVIGHGRKGLARVYDQYRYEAEIRAALEAWQALLRRIINPQENVVPLKKKRKRV
jgi:integrase